jgi:ribosomal protein S18 acetylase RimI-like enzyme
MTHYNLNTETENDPTDAILGSSGHQAKSVSLTEVAMYQENSTEANWHFIVPPRERWGEAIALVHDHLPEELRDAVSTNALQAVDSYGLRFRPVVAEGPKPSSEASCLPPSFADDRGSSVLAAAYLQEYPGQIACLVGPAQFCSSLPSSLAAHPAAVGCVAGLLQTAWEWKVELVQSILEIQAPYPRSALLESGMRKLTNLFQMCIEPVGEAHLPEEKELPAEAVAGESWTSFRSLDRTRWLAWLERTYQQSADCPELNGVRSAEATLEGYLATSKYPSDTPPRERSIPLPTGTAPDERPAWQALTVDPIAPEEIAAGFLLAQTAERVWELAYMGVDPRYRGRGLGKKLLQRAIATVAAQGGQRLWLAVDVRNHFAIRLYQQHGFFIFRELEAWFAASRAFNIDANVD